MWASRLYTYTAGNGLAYVGLGENWQAEKSFESLHYFVDSRPEWPHTGLTLAIQLMRSEVNRVDTDQNANETAPAPKVRVTVDVMKPETCPPSLRKFYSDEERKRIQEALDAGTVVAELKEVRVSKEKSGTGATETWPFIMYRAVQGPGMSTLSRGRAVAAKPKPKDFDNLSEKEQAKALIESRDGACDYFNYGFGLSLMQPIRVMLANSLGGVEKAIDKQVAQMMKLNLFPSEEAARAFVISQRDVMGMEIPASGDDE